MNYANTNEHTNRNIIFDNYNGNNSFDSDNSDNILMIPTANAQNNTSAATTTASQIPLPPASSSNKIFYLFSAEHEDLNETKLGIPEDTYSPDIIVANEGDNVTIWLLLG